MTKDEAATVIKAYRDNLTNSASNQLDGDIKALDMAIQALEQEPKTGHWIDDNDGRGTSCSECGKWYTHPYLTKLEIIYCCKCGARMVEPQEREG